MIINEQHTKAAVIKHLVETQLVPVKASRLYEVAAQYKKGGSRAVRD